MASHWNPEYDAADALHAAEVICRERGWMFRLGMDNDKALVAEIGKGRFSGFGHFRASLSEALCLALIAALDEEEEEEER